MESVPANAVSREIELVYRKTMQNAAIATIVRISSLYVCTN
jgi:hypothetical protein